MKKEDLKELIDKGLSQREISDNTGKSQTSIRYWLKRHNLKTIHNSFEKKVIIDGKKECTKCGELKELKDFYKRENNGFASKCKKCANDYYTKRQKKIKIKMIEYKGGECERCSLKLEDTHYAVFDFHHIDPNEKDDNFKKIKFQKWEKIKKEIDKCMLVCSNCHREIHAEIEGW